MKVLIFLLLALVICSLSQSADPPAKLAWPNDYEPDERTWRDSRRDWDHHCPPEEDDDFDRSVCCPTLQLPYDGNDYTIWYKDMPDELAPLLEDLFPEGSSPFSGFTAEDVFVKCLNPEPEGCWIDITWLLEGAGNRNTFGYYFFDVDTGTIIGNVKPLFPDTSALGSAGCHKVGDTTRIENIPYGTVVGFYMYANGADYNSQAGDSSVLNIFSVVNYDIEGGLQNGDGIDGDLSDAAGYDVPSRHFGWVRVSSQIEGLDNLIIFGCEDLPWDESDRDYNDVMFALEVGPFWNSDDILTYDPETKIIYRDSCIPVEQVIEGPDFRATVTISDPNMNGNGFSGTVEAEFAYSWSYGAYSIRILGDNSNTPLYNTLHTFDTTCTIDHDGEYRYTQGSCGCEDTFIGTNQPQLFLAANSNYYSQTYTTTTINGQTVRVYVQNPDLPHQEAVSKLYVLDSDINSIVRVDWIDGRVMTFSDLDFTPFDFSFTFDESDFDCTCQRALDIVLLVERSNNVYKKQMENVKKFLLGDTTTGLQGLIDDYDINSEGANFAVMSYDGVSDTKLDFTAQKTRSNVKSGINSLTCSGSDTDPCGSTLGDLPGAINDAVDLLLTSQRNVQKNILVITNGWYTSNDNNDLVQQAVQDAADRGVSVYTVFYEPQITETNLKYITLDYDPDYYIVRYNTEALAAGDPIDINSRLCLSAVTDCGDCCGFCNNACNDCIPVDDCSVASPDCRNPVLPSGTCCVEVDNFDPCSDLDAPAERPCNYYECGTDGTCQEVEGCVADPNVPCQVATCVVNNGVGSCQKYKPQDQKEVCVTKTCVDGEVVRSSPCPEDNECYSYTCVNDVCQRTSLLQEDACTYEICNDDGTKSTVDKCPEPSDDCYNRYCDPNANNGQGECVEESLARDETCFYEECQSDKTLKVIQKCRIDDTDPCYVYSCDEESGECLKTPLGESTLCYDEVCSDDGTSLIQIPKCQESDDCYDRSCDPQTGCQAVFVGQNTPCNIQECQTIDGVPTLVDIPVDCSHLASPCLDAVCDDVKGCTTTPKPYDGDLGDNPCYDHFCSDDLGGWQDVPKDCTSDDACFTSACDEDPASETAGQCVLTPAIDCVAPDACTVSTCVDGACVEAPAQDCSNAQFGLCDTSYCDTTTGDCVDAFVECPNDVNTCQKPDVNNFPDTLGCNPSTGECVYVDVKCSPDGCVDMGCVPNTGSQDCVEISRIRCDCTCDETACQQYDCDKSSGTPTCVALDPVECVSPDFCNIAAPCDPVNGCVITPVSCASVPTPNGKCDIVSKDPTNPDCCVVNTVTCTNDNPKCFNVDCDPADGKCKTTPIPCTPADACETAVCTAADGCVKTPVTCNNPPNSCQVGHCDPDQNGKCVYELKDCDDQDPCTLDSCDPNQNGLCVHVPKCDDKNDCTVDSCSADGTCIFTPLDCSDEFKCTIDTCVDGQCVHTPRVCDDGLWCTIDTCSEKNGQCSFTPRVCDDKLPCTIDFCDEDNDQCSSNPKVCDDGKRCTDDSCNTSTGTCRYVPVVCDDQDACTNDSCSESGDESCIFEPIVCDDGDPCTISECVNGSCTHTPIVCELDGNPCTIDVCVNGTCQSSDRDCDDGSMCTNNYCDVETGSCVTEKVNCDDGISCTIDECKPDTGCVHTAKDILCSRNDPCTEEICDLELGCVSSNVTCPEDDSYCTTIYCKPFSGCTKRDINCTAVLSSNNQSIADNDCSVIYCDEDSDKCAVQSLVCGAPVDSVVIGTSVGAAVIVGIVVAVIVAAACTGGGVYAVINRTGVSDDAPVTNNPLYVSNAKGGDNLLYQSST